MTRDKPTINTKRLFRDQPDTTLKEKTGMSINNTDIRDMSIVRIWRISSRKGSIMLIMILRS